MTWTTQPRFNRGALAYIERGQGPNVLLIHGVGLCADAWGAQLDDLSRQYTLCAVDMPGHGQSHNLSVVAPSLGDYADVIATLIDGPTVVVGHSMGAMLAIQLAAQSSDVIGVAALNGIYQRDSIAHAAVIARAAALSTQDRTDPTPTLHRWFTDMNLAEAKACDHWLRTVSLDGYKSAYSVFAHENGPSEKTLANLSCPALFMTGADEPNSTPAMSHAMAATCPNGHAVIVENAAHMMPMTHRSEVNAHLLSFLERCTK